MSYKHVDPAEFRAQFEAGLNHAELTAHFGCNSATTSRIHKRLGLPPFAGAQNWFTPERRGQVQHLLDDGCSFAEIVRTTGVHPDTLRRHFPGQQWTKQQRAEWQRVINQQTGRLGLRGFIKKGDP